MWSSRRLPFVCIVSGSRGWLLLLVPVLFCYPAFQWWFLQQFVNRKSLPSFWFNICSDTMQLCPSYSIMWYHSKMHFLMSPGFLEMGCIRGRRWCLWREYLLSSAHVMLGDFGCSFLVCSGFHQCSGHNRLCWDLHSFGVGSLVRDVSLHLLRLIICKYVDRLDQEVICTHLVLWLNFVLLKYRSIWGPSTMILWCGFQGCGAFLWLNPMCMARAVGWLG